MSRHEVRLAPSSRGRRRLLLLAPLVVLGTALLGLLAQSASAADAPPPTLLSSPSSPGSGPSPTWTFELPAAPAPSTQAVTEPATGTVTISRSYSAQCAFTRTASAPDSAFTTGGGCGSGTGVQSFSGSVTTDGSYWFSVRTVETTTTTFTADGDTTPTGEPDVTTSTSNPVVAAAYVHDGNAPVLSVTGVRAGADPDPHFAITADDGTAVSLSCTVEGATVPCSVAGGLDLALGTDGDYDVTVTATDAGGRTTTESFTYVLDAFAPTVTGPAAGSDRTPTWTFGGTPATAAACTFTGPGATGGTCSPSGFTAGALPVTTSGTYSLSVRLSDSRGNEQTVVRPYLLDSAVDATVVAPASPGRDQTPTWTVSAGEPVTVVSCALTSGAASFAGTCDDSGFTAAPLAATGGTDYLLTMVLRDGLGNETTVASSYSLDTTTSVVVSPATRTSRTTSPVFTFTGDAWSSATCSLTRRSDGVVVGSGSCVGGSWTAPALPGTAGTTYDFAVRVDDAAGNTATGGSVYVLDTQTAVVLAPKGRTSNDTTPSWTVTGDAWVSAVCTLTTGSTTVDTRSCLSGTYDAPTLPDSGGTTYTLSVAVTDAAGNTATDTDTYALDTATAVTVSPATRTSNDTTPTWTFDGDAWTSATCTLTRGGAPVASAACSSGTWTAPVLTPGTYLLTVDVVDAAGNTGSGSATYELDTSTTVVLAPKSRTSNDTTPTWTVTGDTWATAVCTLRQGSTTVHSASCTGGSYTPPALPGSGGTAYVLTVVVTDAAGNSATDSDTYLLDTATSVALAVKGRTSNDTTPSWSVTGDTWVSATCTLTRAGTLVDTAACTGGYTAPVLPDTGGTTYTLTVAVTDAAGNTATDSDTYLLDTATSVTVSPSGRTSNDTTPDWTFSGDTWVSATCVLRTAGGALVQSGACSSLAGHTAAALPGTAGTDYVLTVTVTDAAGNTSSGTAAYRLDTVTAVTVSPATRTSNDTTPDWTFAGDTWASATCVLRSGTTVVQTGACSTLTGHTATALPGTSGTDYLLTVTVTDTAGNTATDTAAYRLDTTTAVTVTPAARTSNDTTPDWTFTGDTWVSATCVLRTTGGAVVQSGPCSSLGTHTATALPGTAGTDYVLTVTVTDAAGNTANGTATYRLDTVTDVSASPATRTSNDTTPDWTFSGDTWVSATCVLREGSAVVQTGACSSLTGHTAAALPGTPGTDYVLTVTVVDAAGNTATDTAAYRLDTVTSVAVTPVGATSNDTTPTWSVSGDAWASATCTLTRGGTLVQTAPCTGGSFTASPLPATSETTYLLTVDVVDAAGNTATVSTTYVLDTTTSVVLAVKGRTSNDTTPTWTLTGDAWTAATCTLRRAGTVVETASCTAGFTASELPGTSGTTYVLTVVVTDAAGNTASDSDTYVLDTVTSVAVSPATRTSNDTTPTWTFAGDTWASATCTLTRGGTVVETTACAAGTFTAAALPLTPGTSYVLTVAVVDAAGNTATGTATYLLDTVATVAVSPATRTSNDTTPTWSVTGDAWTSATCTLTRSGSSVAAGDCLSGSWTAPVLPDTAGTDYLLTVVVGDAAGNTATTTATYRLDTVTSLVLTPGQADEDRDTTPTWSFAGDTWAGVSCTLTRGTTVLTGGSCSLTGYAAPALPGTSGNDYVLSVTVTDAAGNTATATAAYRLDTITSVVVVRAPGQRSTGNDRTPSWTFTGDAWTSVTCTLTGPAGTVDTAPCAAGYTAPDLGATSGADYRLTVTVRDAAGNTATGTDDYRLDTVTSVTASPATRTSNDTTPSWSFAGDVWVTATCVLSTGSAVVQTGACSSLTAHTAAALPGTSGTDYVLTVTVTDAAGNTASDTVTYRLDTATTVTVSPAARTSNDTTPDWTFTGDTWVSASCVLRAGTTVVQTGACDALGTHTAAALPGTSGTDYVLTVTVTDAAGNTASGTASYRLDTVTAVTVAPAARTSNDTTPDWTFTGDTWVSASCVLRTGTAVVDSGPCDALGTHTAAALPGTSGTDYVLTVTVTDAAGNTASGSASYRLDTVTAVTVSPATRTSNDRKPSWSFTGDTWTSASCVLTTDGTVVDSGPCDTLGSHQAKGLPGTSGTDYLLTVTVTDAAGNTASDTAAYRLDTVTAVTVSPATRTSNDTTPDWTFTGDAWATATCVLSTGGTVVQTGACDALGTHSASTLPGTPGTDYVLTVTVTDLAGNTATGTASYRLDTVTAVTVSPATRTSNDTTPDWTFTGDTWASAVCVLSAGGTVVQTGPCSSLGAHTAALLPATPGTDYALTVTVTDAAGNTASDTVTYRLDTVTAVTVSPATRTSNDTTPDWTFTGDTWVSASCVLRAGTTVVQTGPCDALGTHTASALPGTSGTDYVLTVTVTDAAGNTASGTAAYRLDTVTSVVVSPAARTSNDTTPSWTFAGDTWASASCVLRSGTVVVETGACSTLGAHTASALPDTDGTDYTMTVTVTDVAGNTASATATYHLDTRLELGVAGPSGPSSDRSPTWTFTGEPGLTLTCTVTGPSGPVQTSACGAGGFTAADLPTTTGTTYVLSVLATDDAGNTTTLTSDPYLLDTDVQLAVAPPASPGNDTTPSWTFSGETYTTAVCRLTGPGGAVVVDDACTTLTGFTAPALPGTTGADYVLTVTVTDRSGTSRTLTTSPYHLDTVLELTVGLPTTPSPVRTPSWSFGDEAYVSAACTLTGPAGAVTGGTCTTAGYTAPTLPTSTGADYVLTVTLVDTAGNSATRTLPVHHLDTVGELVVTGSRGPSNDTTPDWTFAGETWTSVRCTLTGPAGTVTGGSCTSAGFTAPVLPGTTGADYVLTVTAVDTAGNSVTVTAGSYRLDTVLELSVVGPTGTASDTTPEWTYADEPYVSVVCTLTGPAGPVGGGTCGPDRYTAPTLPGTTGADYALTVRATDAAGNVRTVVSATYHLDTVLQLVVSGPAGPAADRTPSWTFAGEPWTSVSCLLTGPDGSPVAGTTCDATGLTAPSLAADGLHTLAVTAVDGAGNTRTVTVRYELDTLHLSVRGPVGPSPDRRPTWTFDDEPYTAATCVLTAADGTVAYRGACTTTSSFTAPLLPLTPGTTYVLTVTATDSVGTTGTVASAPYRLDTQLPVATITGPTGAARTGTVTWTVASDEALTAAGCVLERDGVGVQAFASCPGTTTLSLPADGRYTLVVTLTDLAGNVSTTRSAVYVYDGTAPGAPTVAPASVVSNVRTVTWSVTGEAGLPLTCRLLRDGVLVFDWAACDSGVTTTLGADGRYVLEARSTDPVGPGAVGSATYLLDTVAPGAPAVRGPVGPSQDRAPTWTFTAEAGSTRCRLVRGTTIVTDWAACSATGVPVSLVDRPDGAYVLEVEITDAAGNVTVGRSAPYVLDTTAPDAPVVAGPVGPSPDRAPRFTWIGEAGTAASCRLSRDGVVVADWTACTSPYVPALDTDGTWTLTVRLTDAAGNTSLSTVSAGYVLDTTPPVAPTVTPPGPTGRSTTPSWAVVTEASTTLSCRLTGPAGLLADWASCTSPHVTSLVGDGRYVLEVRATDAAGNTGGIGSAAYVLDTAAPAAPVVAPTSGVGRVVRPVLTFTAEAGTTARCRVTSGATVVFDWGDCTSPATIDLSTAADGAFTLSVRVTDAAGNISAAGSATYVLDTTAPAAPVFTVLPSSPGSADTVTFAWTGEPGATFSCSVVTPTGVRAIGACTSPLSVPLLGDGSYTLQVRAVDAAGNLGPVASATYVRDANRPAGPTISGITGPSSKANPSWSVSGPGTLTCRILRGTTVLSTSDCSGVYQVGLFGQPDGVYTVEVRSTTSAGTSEPATLRYTYDTTPPAIPTIVGPPSPGTDRHPLWTIASAEATTATCQLYLLDSPVGASLPCAVSPGGSVYSGIDLTGLGDGRYALVVRVFDAAGNEREGRSTYVLDTAAAPAVAVFGPVRPSFDPAPSFTIVAPSGTRIECRLAGPDGPGSWADCTPGAYRVSLSGLPDGAYTLVVHALSAAGTPGPEAQAGYVLDTLRPAKPLGVTAVMVSGARRDPSFNIAYPALVSRGVCVVKNAKQEELYRAECDKTFTMDLSSVEAGVYLLFVYSLDDAGNLSEDSASAKYELKTVPPALPGFVVQPGDGGSTMKVDWQFTVVRGAHAECRLTGPDGVTDWARCSADVTALIGTGSFSLALETLPDGLYILEVRAVDVAGSSRIVSDSYRLTRTALPVPSVRLALAGPVVGTQDLAWTLEPAGATLLCEVYRDGTFLQPVACSPGTLRFRAPGAGTYRLQVSVVVEGVRGEAASATYVVDIRPPAARIVVRSPGAAGRSATPTFTWSNTDGDPVLVSCDVYRNGVLVRPDVDCTDGLIDLDLVDLGGVGTYRVDVQAVDAAGNPSPISQSTYVYDLANPDSPTLVKSGSTFVPVWTWAMSEGTAQCTLRRGGITFVDERDCTSGRYSYDLSRLPYGDYVLQVVVTDPAGNVSTPARSAHRTSARPGSVVVNPPTTPTAPDDDEVPLPPGPGRGGTGVGAPVVTPSETVPPPITGPRTDGTDAGTEEQDTVQEREESTPRQGRTDVQPAPALSDVPEAIAGVVTESLKRPTLPLVLLVIVVLFLLAQNRIDRRDPKLASAPVEAEPELDFLPFPLTGGAQ